MRVVPGVCPGYKSICGARCNSEGDEFVLGKKYRSCGGVGVPETLPVSFFFLLSSSSSCRSSAAARESVCGLAREKATVTTLLRKPPLPPAPPCPSAWPLAFFFCYIYMLFV